MPTNLPTASKIPYTVAPASTPTIVNTIQPTPTPLAHTPLIAFTMLTQDGKEAIYTIHPDGSDLTPLVSGQDNSFSPSWSPNGQKIAYLAGDRFKTAKLTILDYESGEIMQVDVSGGWDIAWRP